MKLINKKKISDFSDYVVHSQDKTKIKYGLNQDIVYCSNCLMSNQRPNMCAEHYHTAENQKSFINFENDLCAACKLSKKKKFRY